MKLSAQLETRFNAQITLELESFILYRQLAIEADEQNLPGVALWLRYQGDEEVTHANKFIDHVNDRGNSAQIGAIPAPVVEKGQTPLQLFELVVRHEQKVSQSIRELYRAAEAESDFDSRPILNWFVEEQIQEEATAGEIVSRLRRIDDDASSLLNLDEQLGQRQPPAAEAVAVA